MSIEPMQATQALVSTEPISLMSSNLAPPNVAALSFVPPTLAQRFAAVRQQTIKLSLPLSEADMTIQADDFVSPSKWHLAHSSWFFEEFFLKQLGEVANAWVQSADYRFLFNSYYETIGKRQAQGRRGLITRPDLSEVLRYRSAVDKAVIEALQTGVSSELADIIELGLHHEQQHQELFLTDILYNLAQNPISPAYQPLPASVLATITQADSTTTRMVAFEGGVHSIGHQGLGYGFDNEFPRHKTYLEPYRLATSLVSNADWIAFIEDGGYQNPLLWLADGWKAVQSEEWRMPLYWQSADWSNADSSPSASQHQDFRCMTLAGLQPVNRQAPVCHISYFEADAYARWAGKRLPTEAEWEVAASRQVAQGHFAESGVYMPLAAASDDGPLLQLYGDVWEWTASPYVAYPGFKVSPGAVGEYNGKFMNGQYVLRGGSCVTPAGHIRATYRNFFYPHQRWQFSGLRLAD